LKTAVAIQARAQDFCSDDGGREPTQDVRDLAASFQATVVRSLMDTTARVADTMPPQTLIVAGGVACNERLREAATLLGTERNFQVYFPSRHLSTDNAAMIAAAGAVKLEAGMSDGFDLNADVTMRLQNLDVEDEALRRRVHYKL
jgi:N6-L-threonylcarbamoyladenine synthase